MKEIIFTYMPGGMCPDVDLYKESLKITKTEFEYHKNWKINNQNSQHENGVSHQNVFYLVENCNNESLIREIEAVLEEPLAKVAVEDAGSLAYEIIEFGKVVKRCNGIFIGFQNDLRFQLYQLLSKALPDEVTIPAFFGCSREKR